MRFFLLVFLFCSLNSWATVEISEPIKKYSNIDFNNDGIADVLWRKGNGNYLWYMNADGTHSYKNIGSKSIAYQVEAVADFNGDGNADILWKKGSGNYFWYMNADGTHSYKNIGSKPTAYKVEAVADFNGDGNADILWKKGSGNYLWYMNADGTHRYKNIGSKSSSYRISGTADFNGDGNADILWRRGSGNYLWYMNADGKHSYKNIGSKSSSYRISGIADFNDDGNADILWRRGSGNYLWYMNSNGKHSYKNIGSKSASYRTMLPTEEIVKPLLKRGYLLAQVPISGVEYECNGTIGSTSIKGEFSCVSLPVKFFIGSLKLGTVEKFTLDSNIYPQDLLNLPRDDFDTPKLIKLVRTLESLDNDGNVSSNILISSETKNSFTMNVDNLEVETLVSMGNGHLVSAVDAMNHLKENMSEYLPPIVLDKAFSTTPNSSIKFSLNEENASTLTFSILRKPMHGSVKIEGNFFVYTPSQNFRGTDGFSYQASNGKYNSNVGTVKITVDSFKINSLSYLNGGVIPKRYACSELGGFNYSPQFSWNNAPLKTNKYAIIMDDEVSPCGTGMNACKHWSLFNIPSTISSLNENFNPATISGVVEGKNYFGTYDYEGPCPPSSHRYKTTIYALSDEMPQVPMFSTMTRSQFRSTYQSYILETSTIEGIFNP